MATEFKSRTMQALQAQKQAAQSTIERIVLAVQSEFNRVKQDVEILTGARGKDRAIRQSDLRPLASLTPQSRLSSDPEAMRADILALYEAISRVTK